MWQVYKEASWQNYLLDLRNLFSQWLLFGCLFQESCVVALDVYKYEHSDEFQYADSVVKMAKEANSSPFDSQSETLGDTKFSNFWLHV